MKIVFTVFGNPKSKLRHRTAFKNGRMFSYKNPKTRQAEENFIAVAQQYRPPAPHDGPVILKLRFFREIPKSFSKKKRQLAVEGKLFPTTKPDLDNYEKLVMDAMNTVFWRDDSQVVMVMKEKLYSDSPRTEVEVEFL